MWSNVAQNGPNSPTWPGWPEVVQNLVSQHRPALKILLATFFGTPCRQAAALNGLYWWCGITYSRLFRRVHLQNKKKTKTNCQSWVKQSAVSIILYIFQHSQDYNTQHAFLRIFLLTNVTLDVVTVLHFWRKNYSEVGIDRWVDKLAYNRMYRVGVRTYNWPLIEVHLILFTQRKQQQISEKTHKDILLAFIR